MNPQASTDLVSNAYVVAICAAYGVAAWLIQMYRVATPRDWLLERIYSLEARIETEHWAADTPGRDQLTQIEKSVDRWALILPVSKVQAGWRNVHGIEDQHILELPAYLVDD
jgi:hypothetical protein